MTAGTSLPSLNSLIYNVCRGPAYKGGVTIVSGILYSIPEIRVIAGVGMPVRCYESSHTTVESQIFPGIDTFRVPHAPKNAYYYVDFCAPIENIGVWFLFNRIPLSCQSFVKSAIIIGTEPLLREALKGKSYIPRAHYAETAAMELV